MATLPVGSSPHIVKAVNGTPVGTLADFSLDMSAVPFDPRDTSAQIPTLGAKVTDLAVPRNTLIDENVTFRDWSGSDTTAKVKSVNGAAASGLTSLDTSTMFDRLNTEQTTFPIIIADGANESGTYNAIKHWCLMAGIPEWRTPGNLIHSIPETSQTILGYIADNPASWRFYGPPDTRYAYVPTIGTYLPPLEVNGTMSLMTGAMFTSTTQIGEFRILTWLPRTQTAVNYIVRRIDNQYVVAEKYGTNAETVLLTATYTSTSVYAHNVNLLIQANAADPTKIDLTLRVIEAGAYTVGGTKGVDTYKDFTATGVTSYITQRPLPYKVDMGYDNLLVGSRSEWGGVWAYFLSEGSVLPEKFPTLQFDFSISNMPEAQANDPKKVPGFTANVWEKMKEFCALTETDVFFEQDTLKFRSRFEKFIDTNGTDYLPPMQVNKSDMSWGIDNRETSKYVDVVYREMVGDQNTYTSTELWRADTVYSLEKGEYREELVQTDSTFTIVDQPFVVSGVPVPYTWGYGAYVVTGNDGYIVDPQWWLDNGGSIKVEATGKAGEIKIKLQAPTTDTTRAPYRISEGVADRPALYLRGSGLNLGKSKTIRIATGAGDSAQEAVSFDSIFVTNTQLAYNVGFKVADSMGGADSNISFGVNKSTLAGTNPTGAEYTSVPPGSMVYQEGAIHRITALSMQPSGLSVGKAEQFTTIAATNDGLGPNATVDDWNNLHLGKTVKEVNLAPLPQYIS